MSHQQTMYFEVHLQQKKSNHSHPWQVQKEPL